jgi:hypothetical protein
VWHVVAAAGGYAQNTADWRVALDGGRRVFVKQALDDSSPAVARIRSELARYGLAPDPGLANLRVAARAARSCTLSSWLSACSFCTTSR